MRQTGWMALALAIGLAGCGSGEKPQDSASDAAAVDDLGVPLPASGTSAGAVAKLMTATGKPAGSALATPGEGSMLLSLKLEGLPPGQHGIHVHMTGKCDGPKFESAGGHWNPGNKQHGLENPQGQHAGDMPNVTIGSDGRGVLSYMLKGGTMAGLLDQDGSAIVVHAKVDDEKTDPSGDSGDRIACGVFSPS